ncbi:septal ring lytic transglycosylase RlpA family protein [Oryzicola mucosus]|uniref:Endolytic peptidoglycan transglycosylase RlpA n=1 Tax=Oryzicola mucosus TaxID=2767425 RepID=A0A8J6PUV4_9HYPH|nr:septal ring lytic transglycosylase RlpA family protein [Oryzicola mucosus]MBD0416279.1 septal ring lytic transglycosylase RlpA family protein [Oryzicola mucosus]
MQSSTRSPLGRAAKLGILAVCSALLASCASPQPKATAKKRSKEYFAESVYGVKASPRVAYGKSNLPRGGGRDQTGKPYQVRGKWYYPKEDKKYSKVGGASWYGDAFHGRLTANGEIYDMTHLTAAHPTMPLPSYARVTNMKNGASVIVRVNDRGPYSDGRIIDLSHRAANMLDYAHHGITQVKVDYVGRAPLEGRDDQFLLASYRPGSVDGRKPDPLSDGLPTGVMIAMNGPTPSAPVRAPIPAAAPTMVASASFPTVVPSLRPQAPEAVLPERAPAMAIAPANTLDGQLQNLQAAPSAGYGEITLPDIGPIVPQRPDSGETVQMALAKMSYADERIQSAAQAFAALDGNAMSSDDVAKSWKRLNGQTIAAKPSAQQPYVAAGTFSDTDEAKRVARELSAYGRIVTDRTTEGDTQWTSVSVYPDGRETTDGLLERAWSHGAPDAIVVRD